MATIRNLADMTKEELEAIVADAKSKASTEFAELDELTRQRNALNVAIVEKTKAIRVKAGVDYEHADAALRLQERRGRLAQKRLDIINLSQQRRLQRGQMAPTQPALSTGPGNRMGIQGTGPGNRQAGPEGIRGPTTPQS